MIPFHETPSTGPTAARAAAMQVLVPVIEIRRLVLRAPVIEDFQTYADLVLGPRGEFWGQPADRERAWAHFLQLTGTWYLRGHGGWTVTDRETGETLGFVLIGAEPGDEAPELGFLLTAAAEGRGIAYEAAQAVRDHGFGPMALPRLVSYVDSKNRRSIALAERLGARREDRTSADGPFAAFWHRNPQADPQSRSAR